MKLRDVRKLAETRAAFEFELPVAELPGLPPELLNGDGHVQVQLRFSREQGFAIADVRLGAILEVTCQRCMGPMRLELNTSSPVLVVESEREAEDAPAGWETFLAPEGRLSLAALAAEELLLAVPIVPLHEAGSGCLPVEQASGHAPAATEPAPASAARPFADLRALLERGAKTTK
ncbi:MAG TPA: YceD family protein [Steroidobacteraceae bacterium]